MFSGMMRPGQRETSRKSEKTEITITLKQAAWASVILFVLAIAVHRVALVPLAHTLQRWLPFAAGAVVWLFQLLGNALPIGGLLFPWLAAGWIFTVQVFDQNWPAPRSARSGDQGPAFPWNWWQTQEQPLTIQMTEKEKAVPGYSEREIEWKGGEAVVKGGLAMSPSKRSQGRVIFRVPNEIATEEQLQTLAQGVLLEGKNFSRNYWTRQGLFTDPGWRAFSKWMSERQYIYRKGNSYHLKAIGKAMLRAYLE
jgi:hypothetical protein